MRMKARQTVRKPMQNLQRPKKPTLREQMQLKWQNPLQIPGTQLLRHRSPKQRRIPQKKLLLRHLQQRQKLPM